MISTNSLAAFAQEVSRTRPAAAAEPARAAGPSGSPRAAEPIAAQRLLEAVPPLPGKPLPRGSLLDLRA